MTAETDLLPLPEIYRWYVTGDYAYPTEVHPEGGAVDYDAHVAAMHAYARANVAHAIAPLQAEVEALREALEEIRSRSAINLAMHPNPFELTARLGDIYQIADGALEQEACRG